jgi:site-specific DNA-methyltransferase (adenine-specific)
MVVAIEDAGFEIRDSIHWIYGSGFPKSLDVSKTIDKAAGAERQVVGSKLGIPGYSLAADKGRTVGAGHDGSLGNPEKECAITAPATDAAKQWEGWGTALKPAHEPIVVARKPLNGTVAGNVLQHGTGAMNIDGCRVAGEPDRASGWSKSGSKAGQNTAMSGRNYAREPKPDNVAGRWPANVIHDGSDEVTAMFPEAGNKWKRNYGEEDYKGRQYNGGTFGGGGYIGNSTYADSGSAARFFYAAKASRAERNAQNTTTNNHPTVKPIALMRYLLRLVTPPNGTTLDPFAGSGTTLAAAIHENFHAIGIELTPEYHPIIQARIQHAQATRKPIQ